MESQEITKGSEEIWRLFAETDRQFKETDRKFQETNRERKESDQRLEKLFQETDRQFKETDRKFQESDQKLEKLFRETDQNLEKLFRETDAKIGALTGKWSKFVEGIVVPAADKIFSRRGIQVDKVYQRVRAQHNGKGMEIDVMALDGADAVLIEVKSTLSVDDVKEHLERMRRFKTFFPEYADRRVVGAVAGIVIEEGVDRFAYKRGLFVLGQTGETVRILNDEAFRPRIW